MTEDMLCRCPGHLLRVLLYLELNEGTPVPVSEIAAQLNQMERSVFRNLRELKQRGFIQKMPSPGKASRYSLL